MEPLGRESWFVELLKNILLLFEIFPQSRYISSTARQMAAYVRQPLLFCQGLVSLTDASKCNWVIPIKI